MKRTILLLAAALTLSACCNKTEDTPLPKAKETPAALQAGGDAVFKDVRSWGTNEIHSLIVIQHGKVVYERYAEGWEPHYLHFLWSGSKTFTATAVGFAVQDGLLDVHDKVVKFFDEEELPSVHAPELDSLTIWNLLTMTSGFKHDYIAPTNSSNEERPSVRTLANEYIFAPGTDFKYNSMNTYLLSAIVTKVTGKKVDDYLEEKLFRPLGIRRHVWEASEEGYNMGGWGLHVTPMSFAKMGLFILQRGKWNGRQLLQESWFDEAMKKQTDSQLGGHTEYSHGYGYQMWQCSIPGIFRLDGAWSQYCLVIPEKDAVVAINCHCNKPNETILSLLHNVYPVL